MDKNRTMEPLEALMWASMVRQASQGDPEAMEMLQAANKSRAARNQPTVEEELKMIARKK